MATNESLVLGGVEQNSNVGDFVIIDGSLSMNPPKKKSEWVTGADADGAALVRDPLFDNRTIEYDLRVRGQTTTDGALAKIAAISDKLEEAERQHDGMPLVWTPAGGTRSVTFRVLSGEITELPITRTGDGRGYFRAYPVFHVVLTCRPFGYGTEVVGTAVTSSDPVVTTTVAGVTGDVPAEGRLIITDAASQNRRHVEWGLEQRHYDATLSLLIDSDSLVTAGFAGAQATRTGAYDPDALGNNVVRATLRAEPQAICGTGDLSHVGTFRVKARIHFTATASKGYVRLAWRAGDAPWTTNAYASPVGWGDWSEIDLGLITVPATQLGTQRWVGRLEGYTSSTSDVLDVDYLVLIPAGEGYGKARAVPDPRPSVLVARDEFDAMTAGTALNGRVAPAGGTWATSGATTDFTAFDGPGSEETVGRSVASDTSPRFAVLDVATSTDTEVGVSYYREGAGAAFVVARHVDNSNYLRLVLTEAQLALQIVVAGTVTEFSRVTVPRYQNVFVRLVLVVYASGTTIGLLRDRFGNPLYSMIGHRPELATGGSLASGKRGMADLNESAVARSRYYEQFTVATPTAEQFVINAGQSLEVRHDDTLRENSSGTFWGRPPSYRGSRFAVPPAGDQARTSRVLVKARRQDVEIAADAQLADSTTVQVNYTPRYVVVPR